MRKRNWLVVFLMLSLCFIQANTVFAQSCDPAIDPFCVEDPDDYPIDNNVYYLIGIISLAVYFKFKITEKKQ